MPELNTVLALYWPVNIQVICVVTVTFGGEKVVQPKPLSCAFISSSYHNRLLTPNRSTDINYSMTKSYCKVLAHGTTICEVHNCCPTLIAHAIQIIL